MTTKKKVQNKTRRRRKRKGNPAAVPAMMLVNKKPSKRRKRRAAPKTARRRRRRNPADTIRMDAMGIAKAAIGGIIGGIGGEIAGNLVVPEEEPDLTGQLTEAGIKVGVPLAAGLLFGALGQKEMSLGCYVTAAVRAVFRGIELAGPHVPFLATIGLGQTSKVIRDPKTGKLFIQDGGKTYALQAEQAYGKILAEPKKVSFKVGDEQRQGLFLGRYNMPSLGQVADVVFDPASKSMYFLGAVQKRDFQLGTVQERDMLVSLGAVQRADPDTIRYAPDKLSNEYLRSQAQAGLNGVRGTPTPGFKPFDTMAAQASYTIF